MNEQLLSLYSSISSNVCDAIEKYNNYTNVKNTNVHMLAVSQEYYKSQYRIMIYGKETYGWFGENDGGETIFDRRIPPILSMQLYDLFIKETLTHSMVSPFWKEYCRLHDILRNKSIGIMQSNIAKIGFEYGNTGFDRDINLLFKDVF